MVFILFSTSLYSHESNLSIQEERNLLINTIPNEELVLDFSHLDPINVKYNNPFSEEGKFTPNKSKIINSTIFLEYDTYLIKYNLMINVSDERSLRGDSKESLPKIEATEGDTISFDFDLFHPDGKETEMIYFDPLTENGTWNTKVGDYGNHSLKFGIYDGIKITYHYFDVYIRENKNYRLNTYEFNYTVYNDELVNLKEIILHNTEKLGYVEDIFCKPDSCENKVNEKNNFFELTATNGYYEKPVYFNFSIYPESEFIYDFEDKYFVKEGDSISIPILKEKNRFNVSSNYGDFNGTHIKFETSVGDVKHRFIDKFIRLFDSNHRPRKDLYLKLDFENNYDTFSKKLLIHINDNKPLPSFKVDRVSFNVTDYFYLDNYVKKLNHSSTNIKVEDCPFKYRSYIDYLNEGTYDCEFILSDGIYRNKENLTIEIFGKNRPAYFRWLKDSYEVYEDDKVEINFNAFDPDQRELEYDIEFNEKDCIDYSVDHQNNFLKVSTDYCEDLRDGYFEENIIFKVNDSLDVTKKNVTLRVNHKNRPPILTHKSTEDRVLRDNSIKFSANFYDRDGDELSYYWKVQGNKINHNDTKIRFRFLNPSNKKVELIAYDGKDKSTAKWNVQVLDWYYR